MKKVVLIAAPLDYARELGAFPYIPSPAPPTGVLSVGSYLAARDVPVELIDVQMDFGFGPTPDIVQVVMRRVAHYLSSQAGEIAWIGISQISNTESGIILAQEIRARLPDTPIILGGYFPTNNYRALLSGYPCITAIVRGDGEAAALAISHSLAEGRSFLSDSTPNLAWRDGQEIHTTPVRPMALDSLPILDFRLLRHPTHYLKIDMITSRGCPFACNYCLESTMRPYASYPVAWVDQQLDHLEMVVPNDRVFICDPIFGVGRQRTLEISAVLGGRRFNYMVESRVDALAPDLVPTLRAAGVEAIFLGVESASAETLLRMNKVKSAAQAQAYVQASFKVLQACFENHVMPILNFMMGFPGDVEADYQASLSYIQQVRQLYERIATQADEGPGFVVMPFQTQVYEGSLLAKQLEQDSSGVVLQADSFMGSKSVIQPSAESPLDMIHHYTAQISSYDAYTPLAKDLSTQYVLFPLVRFIREHPELTDQEGVTQFGDSLQRFRMSA